MGDITSGGETALGLAVPHLTSSCLTAEGFGGHGGLGPGWGQLQGCAGPSSWWILLRVGGTENPLCWACGSPPAASPRTRPVPCPWREGSTVGEPGAAWSSLIPSPLGQLWDP